MSAQERLEYLRGELRAVISEFGDEFRECLYGMPEYEDMTDVETTRVVECAAFYYGGGLRTVRGAVERAVQHVQEWGIR